MEEDAMIKRRNEYIKRYLYDGERVGRKEEMDLECPPTLNVCVTDALKQMNKVKKINK